MDAQAQLKTAEATLANAEAARGHDARFVAEANHPLQFAPQRFELGDLGFNGLKLFLSERVGVVAGALRMIG